jgi:NADH-quinone oxidoreductase subunit J
MDFLSALFYLFAAVLLASSLLVITAKNPVHAVLFLVLAFFNAAGLWMLLHAEFLSIMLVMVYVGAVMVLFLFVVMMLDINIERLRQGFWSYLPLGLIVGLIMAAEMSLILGARYFQLEAMPAPQTPDAGFSNTKELGRLLFTDYLYPFELASVVLLVALIAAVVLTLRTRRDNKAMNPRLQNRVKAAERVRVVKMAAEVDETREGSPT